MKDYTLICGLEIHAELKTKSKMFCGCKNDPFHASAPNIYTCPVCLGMPGGLPVANKKAIEWTLKLGLALNCQVNLFSKFDRKNYFYPDLPKGYQISQYDIPFCHDGYLDTDEGRVRIRRIHLEEDTGKLLHKTVDGKKVSLVDFNRGGVPLVEIVTEPDIQSPAQAKAYAKKIRQIIRFLEIADADMEQGGMRLEANISVQTEAEREAGKLPNYKVEVKNINSFRFLEQAIAYEGERQTKARAKGETPEQETRGYNSTKGETFSQRSKEEAEDYRYFPDPDLPPIRFTDEYVEKLRGELPELPNQLMARWEQEHQVEPRFSERLVADKKTAEWAAAVFTAFKAEQVAPNDIASAIVNKRIQVDTTTEPQRVVELFRELTATASVGTSELEAAVRQVMEQDPSAVEKYRSGDQKVLGFFIGQSMRILGKKVDATELRKTIEKVMEQSE